jgi:hypothetical protein
VGKRGNTRDSKQTKQQQKKRIKRDLQRDIVEGNELESRQLIAIAKHSKP